MLDKSKFSNSEYYNIVSQADIVNIIQNISFLPDEVSKRLTFDNKYEERLKNDMYEHKIQFEKQFGVPWEFSNQNNIDRYILFKERVLIGQNLSKDTFKFKSYDSEYKHND